MRNMLIGFVLGIMMCVLLGNAEHHPRRISDKLPYQPYMEHNSTSWGLHRTREVIESNTKVLLENQAKIYGLIYDRCGSNRD